MLYTRFNVVAALLNFSNDNPRSCPGPFASPLDLCCSVKEAENSLACLYSYIYECCSECCFAELQRCTDKLGWTLLASQSCTGEKACIGFSTLVLSINAE